MDIFPNLSTVGAVTKTKQQIDAQIKDLEDKFDKITNEIDQKSIDRDYLIENGRSTNNIDRVIDNMETKQYQYQQQIEQLQKDRKKAPSAVQASNRDFYIQVVPNKSLDAVKIIKKEVTTDFETDETDSPDDTLVFTNVEDTVKSLDVLSAHDIKVVDSSH
jgi:hypothetical protein